jgi:hypothetical protein
MSLLVSSDIQSLLSSGLKSGLWIERKALHEVQLSMVLRFAMAYVVTADSNHSRDTQHYAMSYLAKL